MNLLLFVKLANGFKKHNIHKVTYFPNGVRGHVNISLKIAVLSSFSYTDVNNVQHQGDVKTSSAGHILTICLASNENKNNWKLISCKVRIKAS